MRAFKPTPALVVALLALIFAMAGTGLAAKSYVISSSSQIKDGAVTGQDIKKSTITGSNVKDNSLTAADFSGSVQGPAGVQGQVGPAGPKGDPGVKGEPGSNGLAGTARAYAVVNFDCAPDGSACSLVRAKNILSVTHIANALYCVQTDGDMSDAPVLAGVDWSATDRFAAGMPYVMTANGAPECTFPIVTYRWLPTGGTGANDVGFWVAIP